MAASLTPTTALVRRPENGSLLAAGQRISTEPGVVMQPRRVRQAAQHMCWDYHRGIGITWFADTYKANAISQVRLFPARIEDPREDPVPIDDPYSLQQTVLDDLAGGTSTGLAQGTSPMMAALAMHDAVAGECHWWTHADPDTGANVHEILSTEELTYTGTDYQVRRTPADTPISIDTARDLLVRLWNPDPAFRDLATSPLFVQQDTLEPLWLLIQGQIAAAKSRLAQADLLLVPNELDYKGTPGPDGENTPLDKELLAAGSAAIRDPRSPFRWFPIVIRGKSDFLRPEFLRTVELFKDMPKETIEQIEALRQRFAHDIDLPTEIVSGLGDLKYSNAWLVDAATWPHLRPSCERVLANFSTYVYQVFLIAGGMKAEDVVREVVWYDATNVIVKPDLSAAADIGIQNGTLSNRAWLRAHGFEEDDAPSDEEMARMFGWHWGDAGLAGTGDWTKATGRIATRIADTQVGAQPVDVVAPDTTPASEPGPTTAPSEPGPPVPVHIGTTPGIAASGNGNGHLRGPWLLADGAPKPVPKRAKLRKLGARLGRIDRDILQRVSVLADERLHGLVRLAGNKLRSAAQGRSLIESQIRGLDAIHIPRQLGRLGSHALDLDETVLVDSAAQSFARKALPWMTAAQLAALYGIAGATDQDPDALEEATAPDRSAWASTAERMLIAGFAVKANEFLYSPDGDVPARGEISDIVAPRSAIRDALAVMGGADPGDSGPSLGIGSGPMAQDALGDGGATVDGLIWNYNDLARTTFPGHLALDGIDFYGWDDDQLATQPEDSWIGDFVFPGDHDGCSCTVDPLTVPADDSSLESAVFAENQA